MKKRDTEKPLSHWAYPHAKQVRSKTMKTYMAHAETVERKWYVVDATGIPLGRLASKVASVLRGKNKPTFTPNVDTGDFVIVINSDKAILTGKKYEDKYYRYHTGYIGGLKEISYGKLMAERSEIGRASCRERVFILV